MSGIFGRRCSVGLAFAITAHERFFLLPLLLDLLPALAVVLPPVAVAAAVVPDTPTATVPADDGVPSTSVVEYRRTP